MDTSSHPKGKKALMILKSFLSMSPITSINSEMKIIKMKIPPNK